MSTPYECPRVTELPHALTALRGNWLGEHPPTGVTYE